MTRMSRCTRSERRMSVHRRRFGSQHPAGAPRVLVIVCALLLASLAAVISTVPTANADTPADPSTTGTASTVSPSTVAVGGTIMFTLSGFPGGVTVQVLIDDGLLAASRSSESEVVTTEAGRHRIRFLRAARVRRAGKPLATIPGLRGSGSDRSRGQRGGLHQQEPVLHRLRCHGHRRSRPAHRPAGADAPSPPGRPNGRIERHWCLGHSGRRPRGGTGRLPDHRHLNPRPQCDSRGAVGARRGQPSADGCLPASSGRGLTPGLRLGAHLYLRYSVVPGCIRIVA